MTTPETRTAEQARAYDAWQDAKRKGVHVHELAAAIAFVRSCLPEPQASKASEGEGRQTDFTESEMRAAPAGEAVSVRLSRDIAEELREDLAAGIETCNVRYRTLHDALLVSLSAPPPSTGDKPTPPPAPASKGDAEYAGNLLAVIHGDGGHYITKHGWIKAVDDAKAKWYDMLARAESAPLSVAPAREGWQELLDMHASVVNMVPGQWSSKYPAPSYQVHATDDNGKRRAVCEALAGTSFERDAVMAYIAAAHNWLLAAARVTPPQQEEDRSWEKECEILANGVVSYPSTASTTGLVYLVPDGRWLTYDQWLILDPSLDRFPSEAAAFSALAKAPRPPA